MTCANVQDWADENPTVVREFLESEPNRSEILQFMGASYPDADYVASLAERLPPHAIRLIADVWLAANAAGRPFSMTSVGPDEEGRQVQSVPGPPADGIQITIQFDGGTTGGASIYFHGLGTAENFFSHDGPSYDAVSENPLPWFSAGPEAS